MTLKDTNRQPLKTGIFLFLVGNFIFLILGYVFSQNSSYIYKMEPSIFIHKSLPHNETEFGLGYSTIAEIMSLTTLNSANTGYRSATRMCSLQERLDHLKSMCLKLNASANTHPTSRFIVDDKRKLVYCSISKAGCTTWKGLMETANTGDKKYLLNPWLVHSSGALLAAKLRRTYQWEPRMDSYSKVLVVRNPFDRAVSAFRNVRIGLSNLGPSGYVYSALKKIFRKSSSGGNKMDKLKFKEFVTFLTNHSLTKQNVFRDRHFLPITDSCDICNLNYDYLLRLETVKLDSGPVLEILDFPSDFLATLPTMNKAKTPQSNSKSTDQSHIKLNLNQPFVKYLPEFSNITSELMQRFVDRYYFDLQLLGYHYDTQNNIASCSILQQNGDVCC